MGLGKAMLHGDAPKRIAGETPTAEEGKALSMSESTTKIYKLLMT